MTLVKLLKQIAKAIAVALVVFSPAAAADPRNNRRDQENDINFRNPYEPVEYKTASPKTTSTHTQKPKSYSEHVGGIYGKLDPRSYMDPQGTAAEREQKDRERQEKYETNQRELRNYNKLRNHGRL